jgi:hypothetical protein
VPQVLWARDLRVAACLIVVGKIDMAARRQVTNKLRDAYRGASRTERGAILDKVVDTTGMGRSTARRLLTGPALPAPAVLVDRRSLRAACYSDDARALLRHVWALMGFGVWEVLGGGVGVVAAAVGRGRRPGPDVRD